VAESSNFDEPHNSFRDPSSFWNEVRAVCSGHRPVVRIVVKSSRQVTLLRRCTIDNVAIRNMWP
jgi:hypothetical protein